MTSVSFVLTLVLITYTHTHALAVSSLPRPMLTHTYTQTPIPTPTTATPLDLLAPADLYTNAVAAGAKKALMPPGKIFKLGIISGAHVGFGALLCMCVGMNVPSISSGTQRLLLGMMGLPFALFMTVVTGAELFTGNTALLTSAVLEKRATFKQLLKSWVCSFGGNLLGTLLIAWMATQTGVIPNPSAVTAMSVSKVSGSFVSTFLKGIMANWLVCMAVYMAIGSSSAVGKFTCIVLPISAFVAIGLEHSVANMFMIPTGMMLGSKVTLLQFLLKNMIPVTLGNIIGGALAVAGGYYSAFGGVSKEKS